MKTKFVAEISSNHNRDLGRCKDFIATSKRIGCDAVKFQLFKVEELFASEILVKRPELMARKEWELPEDFIPSLARYTHELGMEFSCTPFYLEAVDILEPHVDFYKVASYELLWTKLLQKCAGTGKPVVISTGMATMDEIEAGIRTLEQAGAKNVTVLHCTSAYPTPIQEANISAIGTMRDKFLKMFPNLDLKFGFSDHTVSEAAVLTSIYRFDAAFIEFHFDLDGKGAEFGPGHCWLPAQIEHLIQMARDGEKVLGAGKKAPVPSEEFDRAWRADPTDGLRPLLATRQTYR